MMHNNHELKLRRLPQGAELLPNGLTQFRVWATKHDRVELVLESRDGKRHRSEAIEMQFEDGYFVAEVPDAGPGTLYRYRLSGGDTLLPDPGSRFQPWGPEGPSEVIDPRGFDWTDDHWPGVRLPGQVIYEMHVGTFTSEGTWRAAAQQLAELADAGITLIEMMPVADWAGEFGWGYDGVNLFAPTRLYGRPDDFRHFINRAHAVGIGVILDVVYNHFGARSNHLSQFSDDYFTEKYPNEWGQAVNFDGENSQYVRDYFLSNAEYWVREFHIDGYRIDATQAFFDALAEPILAAITRSARDAAGRRSLVIIAESEPQMVRNVRPIEEGGFGMDALWNDDFHHSAMVRLTGRTEAYYTDYQGTADEFLSLLKWGYLYQGQHYRWQRKPRGTPAFGLPAQTFVNYLQNHDQIANSAAGKRFHLSTSPGRYRAMTALFLLAPQTPLLFQGQEFAASTPFCYFLDNPPDFAEQVASGRAQFLAQFPSLALPEMQARLTDPSDPQTFKRCKLDFRERETHPEAYRLHRDLLRLRREDPVLRTQQVDHLHGSVINVDCFLVRLFNAEHGDRLLLVNFGRDVHLEPIPQPLLAPEEGCHWEPLWSSEDPSYGGAGTPRVQETRRWSIPGESTVLLISRPRG